MSVDPITGNHAEDAAAIKGVIAAMFEAVAWNADHPADWEAFALPLLSGALVVPSNRPAGGRPLAALIERMNHRREQEGAISFEEQMLGFRVDVYGSVATAFASYQTKTNGRLSGRGVNAFLLVKTGTEWQIASLAWDDETRANPLPRDLDRGLPMDSHA